MQLKLIQNNRVRYYRAYIDEVYIGPVYTSDLTKAEIDIDTAEEHTEGTDRILQIEVSEMVYERLYSIIYSKAFDKYAALLAGAEYSSYDIRYKMKRKEYSDRVINDVIDTLYKEKYLDDRRYAESYIRSYSKSKSRGLIVKELEYKGITGDWMQDLLEEVYSDESINKEDVIKNLIEKKYKGQDLKDEKVKRRVAAYLIRKGFSFSDINSYLT
jgi:Uncharacterized protein conserved in bacteria